MTSPDLSLRDLLDALPVGVALYDAAGRLRHANAALWAQAGDGTAPLPAGTPLAGVTELMARAGHYGTGDPGGRAALAAGLDRRRVHRHLARNGAGRWHEMTSTPLPDGGSVSLSLDVTGVRRSEAEAVAHAALLESILDRLDTGIAVSDHLLRLTYFNRAYPALLDAPPGMVRLGMARGEIFDRLRALDRLAPMSAEEAAALDRIGLDGMDVRTRERPDGTVLWIRARPVPEGGVLAELGDITALRRAEQAAQERAVLLDGVLGALPHGVCVFGPDRRVRMVNAAYQRIMAGAEVTVGEHHADITARRVAAGEYDAESEALVWRLERDFGAAQPHERTRTRPNGTVMAIRAVPLPGDGLVVVLTDVTARTHAEAQAERRAATLRAMLDNQPDGVALFDAGSHLIAANALAAHLTGLGVEEMVPGRHMLELRARQIALREFGEDAEEAERAAAARGERPLESIGRYVRRRPDGTLVEVRTDPTPDGGFIRTYRDVTEERRARAELEAARDAAEAASRAKSGFLATMTHELRTPLHAVIGFSEAILDETRPEAVRDHAREVLAAGRQLLGLVDGLLEATRIEAGSLSLRGSVFDPAPVLRAAATAARRKAEEAGLAFAEDLPDSLPPLRADRARLRQVMDSLLSNAVKFTPPGGRVTLSAVPDGAGTVVSIADTGIGMAPEDIPRAFEAFTQLEAGLSRRYEGSGLGLYLARALTGAMGIGLSLESAPGQGTTARLALPPAEETTP